MQHLSLCGDSRTMYIMGPILVLLIPYFRGVVVGWYRVTKVPNYADSSLRFAQFFRRVLLKLPCVLFARLKLSFTLEYFSSNHHPLGYFCFFSPPVRWGLLDFIRAVLLLLLLLRLLRLHCLLRLLTRRLLLAVQIPVAQPDLHRELQIPVGTAGPQPRLPDHSGHCRTSTATSRSQWALPDLNRDFQIAVGTAGPQREECEKRCQIECQKICQIECQQECQKECQKICQTECQKICQTECQKICQIECQKICQIECQKKCQKICQIECQKEGRKICQKECSECHKVCQKEYQKICQIECQKNVRRYAR